MGMELYSTGNTEEEARFNLDVKRKNIELETSVDLIFGEITVYGNFELGYKFVQEYKVNN